MCRAGEDDLQRNAGGSHVSSVTRRFAHRGLRGVRLVDIPDMVSQEVGYSGRNSE
jgi:hypothetical protein